MRLIKTCIVEDLREIREGMKSLLEADGRFEVLAAFSDAETAEKELPAWEPDIVIMDINLPGMNGIECIRKVKDKCPKAQFTMFTIYEDDEKVFEALMAGASGYLLKKTALEKICDALVELSEGGSPMSTQIARKVVNKLRSSQPAGSIEVLSPRENEVLQHLAKGLLYKEIADKLGISLSTVRQHIHNIYDKMHVQNRAEAINKVFGRGNFLMIILLCCMMNAIAQTDTSFTLLWYKGIRIDDSTLLTTSGQKISFHPSKGKADVFTPLDQDRFKNLRKAAEITDQRKNDIDHYLITLPNGPMLTGIISQVNQGIDRQNEQAGKLTDNTVHLTQDEDEYTRPPAEPFEGSSIPVYMQKYYEEALAAANAIRKDYSVLPPPPPPSIYPDYCFPCDAKRRAKFTEDSARFMQYLMYEEVAIQKAFTVIGYFYFRKVKHLPYDTARAWKMEIDMKEAMETLFLHKGNKIKVTWTTYNDDITKMEFLVYLCEKYMRDQQLTQLPSYPDFPQIDEILEKKVAAARSYLAKAMHDRDYTVLLNIAWVAQVFRMPELYGVNDKSFEYGMENYIGINLFNVSVDAYARTNYQGARITARMKSESMFIAVPDSNCVLKWTMVQPKDTMVYKLEDADMQLNSRKATYTGTRKWGSYMPDLRLDFCNGNKKELDTAFLYGYFPLEGEETWEIKGMPGMTTVISFVFATSFMDVKRMQAIAADPNLQANMAKEMMAKYEQYKKNSSGKDPAKMNPQEIEQLNRAMSSSQDLKKMVHPTLPTSFLVRGKLKNGEAVVFNSQLNGKELFPENQGIQEAILTLKIEHLGNTKPSDPDKYP